MSIEKNPSYKALKSLDGKIVGYVCVECGRLHTAPHRDGCILDGPEKTGTADDNLSDAFVDEARRKL